MAFFAQAAMFLSPNYHQLLANALSLFSLLVKPKFNHRAIEKKGAAAFAKKPVTACFDSG